MNFKGLKNLKVEKRSSFSTMYAFLMLPCVLLYSCNTGNSKNQVKATLSEIPVLELQTKSIVVPKTYVCDIQAVQFVEVRAKVEGFVDNIFVDEGQEVKKNQPLFQLTSNEYNEIVNSSNAKLMQAKAEAKATALEVERLKILVEKNIISSSELDLAKAQNSVAESAIVEAQSLLQNAKTGLSYTTIRAPFDGIVDRIPYKTGSLVTSGDLLTNITDIDEVFAYYKVTENEYLSYMRDKIESLENDSTLKEKEELSLILSDGERYQYSGKLETMEADFEKGTGSIAFRVRFPNPDQLIKHGASGKIQMNNMLEDIFLIPQKSTFEIQDYSYVYVLTEDNKVQVRSFVPMQRYGVYYISDSFQPGDKIILEGIQQLKDGMEINPVSVSEKEAYDTLFNSLD